MVPQAILIELIREAGLYHYQYDTSHKLVLSPIIAVISIALHAQFIKMFKSTSFMAVSYLIMI